MTEQDDPPSAKNLERIRLEPAPKAEGVKITIERDVLEASLDSEKRIIETMQKRLADSTLKLAQSAYLEALSDGTATINVDEGYCGLGIETGKHDPWWKRVCQPHDAHYNALKAGKPDTSNVKAQAEFATGILKGMAEGAWMLISGPFYLVFGGLIGGTLRYTQLQRRKATKEGKPWPKNEGTD